MQHDFDLYLISFEEKVKIIFLKWSQVVITLASGYLFNQLCKDDKRGSVTNVL